MVEGVVDVEAVEEEGPEAQEVAEADGGVPIEKEVAREWTLLLVFIGTEPKVLHLSSWNVEAATGQDNRCSGIIDGPEGHQ